MKINYVGYGMAYTHADEIFMNKHLTKPEYSMLHDWIVQHELAHDPGSFTKHDFTHDLAAIFGKPKEVSKLYFKFFFSHPSAWINSLPFSYNSKHNIMLFDINKLWQLAIIILVVGLLAWWLL